MAVISPEQRIYSKVRKICADLFGEDNVFDYLPGDVPYPFVYIGDQFSQNIREHKDGLNKDIQLVIHVWHDDWKQRGLVTGMIRDIEQAIAREFGTDGETHSMTFTTDRTTNVPLMHATIDVDIRI